MLYFVSSGISLAIVGAFLLINFSNKNEKMLDAEEIMEYAQHLPFVLYLVNFFYLFIFLCITFLRPIQGLFNDCIYKIIWFPFLSFG